LKGAASPAEAVVKGGIVVTMLSDDAAVLEVTEGRAGFSQALGPGLHISMSTVSPGINRGLAQSHEALGGFLVGAPVFGRPDAAASARLNIAYSGGESARAKALPILQALGQRTQSFGDDPGAANVVKLCGNFLIFSATQALAESLSVAEANGLGRRETMDFFATTNFACPVYEAYGSRLADEDYSTGGFKLSLAAKDLRLFAAQRSADGMQLKALLEDRFEVALGKGWGDLDVTALAGLLKT